MGEEFPDVAGALVPQLIYDRNCKARYESFETWYIIDYTNHLKQTAQLGHKSTLVYKTRICGYELSENYQDVFH